MRTKNSSTPSVVTYGAVSILLAVTLIFCSTEISTFSYLQSSFFCDGFQLPPHHTSLKSSIRTTSIRQSVATMIPSTTSYHRDYYRITSSIRQRSSSSSSTTSTLYSTMQPPSNTVEGEEQHQVDNASTLPQLLNSLWKVISHVSKTMTREVSVFDLFISFALYSLFLLCVESCAYDVFIRSIILSLILILLFSGGRYIYMNTNIIKQIMSHHIALLTYLYYIRNQQQ